LLEEIRGKERQKINFRQHQKAKIDRSAVISRHVTDRNGRQRRRNEKKQVNKKEMNDERKEMEEQNREQI